VLELGLKQKNVIPAFLLHFYCHVKTYNNNFMYSNYKLGFIRSAPRTAAPQAPQAPQATAAAPKMAAVSTPFASRTQGTVTKSNRFSVNRLIHVKNSGGCRSCGS
jgi:hypothetical protein